MVTKKMPLRDPEKTRTAILEEAIRSFARAGFHGVGLAEICEGAKVNKRMIYHYFQSKEGLYRAAHQKEWEELQAWLLKELSRKQTTFFGGQARTLLLEAVEIFHDFLASHQLFLRLLMWDGLEGGLASRNLWKEVRGPLYHQIEGLVENAQEQGVLSHDLKASHLIISFMGAMAFYFSHAHTMGDIFRKNPLSREAIAERKEQILSLFQKILL